MKILVIVEIIINGIIFIINGFLLVRLTREIRKLKLANNQTKKYLAEWEKSVELSKKMLERTKTVLHMAETRKKREEEHERI